MAKSRHEKGSRLRGEGTLVLRSDGSLTIHSLWRLGRCLRSLVWRGGRRLRSRRGRQRDRCFRTGVWIRGSSWSWRVRERLIEHRSRSASARRCEREEKGEEQKQSPAPPARLCEKISCL